MSWRESYLDRFYRSRPGWIDGTSEFFELCTRSIPEGSRILEIGAGASNAFSRRLAALGELHGLDPDPAVAANDALGGRAQVWTSGPYPYPDGAFDAAVSNYVLEHVSDPDAHLEELRRVLRPGAPYVFRTPNLLHYVAAVSHCTPHAVHTAIANRLRALPDDAPEPFPTVYRMNRPATVRELARKHGFQVEELRLIEKEPSYGLAARPLFLALLAYERLVNASEALAGLRANILGVLRRGP